MRSGTSVPINILGIGGNVERGVLEAVRSVLVGMGARENEDNGAIIGDLLRRIV